MWRVAPPPRPCEPWCRQAPLERGSPARQRTSSQPATRACTSASCFSALPSSGSSSSMVAVRYLRINCKCRTAALAMDLDWRRQIGGAHTESPTHTPKGTLLASMRGSCSAARQPHLCTTGLFACLRSASFFPRSTRFATTFLQNAPRRQHREAWLLCGVVVHVPGGAGCMRMQSPGGAAHCRPLGARTAGSTASTGAPACHSSPTQQPQHSLPRPPTCAPLRPPLCPQAPVQFCARQAGQHLPRPGHLHTHTRWGHTAELTGGSIPSPAQLNADANAPQPQPLVQVGRAAKGGGGGAHLARV